MSFAPDPPFDRVYHKLLGISRLADEVTGKRPFSQGRSHSSALAELKRALIDREDPAFSILSEEPPFEALLHDSDFVEMIMGSLNIFSQVSEASTHMGNSSLSPLTRALWPHIAIWASVLHPPYGSHQHVSIARDVAVVANAYLAITASDRPLVRQFFHSCPDAVLQICELWLSYPQLISPRGLDSSSAADSARCLINLMTKVFDILVHPSHNPTGADEDLFIRILRCAAGDSRFFLYAAMHQTDFLRSLSMAQPLIATTWTAHFSLIYCILGLEKFNRSRIPKGVIENVVATALYCLESPDTRFEAVHAVHVISLLCGMSNSSSAMVRAIDAGIFEVMRTITSDPLYIVGGICHFLCAGLLRVRVVRAFCRRYRQPIDPGSLPEIAGQQAELGSCRDVARMANAARELYMTRYHNGEWKRKLQCGNAMGPHDRGVRACPCAREFYCSGSCQRMDEMAHQVFCTEKDGPWALRGAVSLADAMYICAAVIEHMQANHKAIARSVRTLLVKLQESRLQKQIVVRLDLARVLPSVRHDVYARTTSMSASSTFTVSETVLVEVSLRVGRSTKKRSLPFTYSIKEFIASTF
ncbi:uncharacterized protein SCHCODRAFT_02588587 [Schizophyllum commune H4-8]|uniref:uncharacterized protein n=1 Tax=Schizophyllum commune (strain H4-8 / FGSC 9210) TaxID=578458 RepID=UPI00215FCACB|nr:uncharacterized protein SCHCODRAFT_02588587 [Schizophyllum commune H4-8]KAI5887402.1 hypothetical protein SCHCODRAFT_02588587 [Schizophyllum commune H4-8]